MKFTTQRKFLRLTIHLEGLLEMLKRDGFLDKDRILASEAHDAFPGPTILPDDARLAGATIDHLGLFLEIDIEADSFGDELLWDGAKRRRSVQISFPKGGGGFGGLGSGGEIATAAYIE